MKYITQVIFTFCVFGLFGQPDNRTLDEKMQMNRITSEHNWFYKHVFLDYKLSVASEYFIAEPQIREYYITKEKTTFIYPNTYVKTTDTIKKSYSYSPVMISLVSFTAEPRINIVSQLRYSVFLKSPLTFGLSVSKEEFNLKHFQGRYGVLNLSVPLLIGFARGLNSSYSNFSKNGFAVSAGFQNLYSPVIRMLPFESYFQNIKYETPVSEPLVQKVHWFLPMIQFDYYRLNSTNKIQGFSFAISPGKSLYLKMAFNFGKLKK